MPPFRTRIFVSLALCFFPSRRWYPSTQYGTRSPFFQGSRIWPSAKIGPANCTLFGSVFPLPPSSFHPAEKSVEFLRSTPSHAQLVGLEQRVLSHLYRGTSCRRRGNFFGPFRKVKHYQYEPFALCFPIISNITGFSSTFSSQRKVTIQV